MGARQIYEALRDSGDSLCKTGIFADVAGDFADFGFHICKPRILETEPKARKAGISGPFRCLPGSQAKSGSGWLATQC